MPLKHNEERSVPRSITCTPVYLREDKSYKWLREARDDENLSYIVRVCVGSRMRERLANRERMLLAV